MAINFGFNELVICAHYACLVYLHAVDIMLIINCKYNVEVNILR